MHARLFWPWAVVLAASWVGAAGAGTIRGRVVDAKGAAVSEAVVFVQQMPPDVAVPEGTRRAIVDQIDKEFVPHVLPVVVGTEVRFPNHDQIHHHVYSFSRTKTFETPLYKGEEAPPVLFDQLGAVKLGCNIHDWMSAVIFVVPNPLVAVTDAEGAFAIADVPDGAYTVAAWHEGLKGKGDEVRQQIEVRAGAPEVTFALDLARRTRAPRWP